MSSAKKSRYWAFVMYPDSCPENWKSILSEYHIAMAVSPLHDADINADGGEKKPHYHVIVVYGNTTTCGNIQEISDRVNGTVVIPVLSLKGYYRYLTHEDNPEKTKYDQKDISHLSGFDPLDYWAYSGQQEVNFKIEIIDIIKKQKITEYLGLMEYLLGYDVLLFKYASEHTLFFNSLVTSLRHQLKDSRKVVSKELKVAAEEI